VVTSSLIISENFDHKAKAGRLLITFTSPSVFFENCTDLVVDWKGFNVVQHNPRTGDSQRIAGQSGKDNHCCYQSVL